MNCKSDCCSACSMNLNIAKIRYNWHYFGPLKQLSRVVGFPQELVEKIGSYITPKYHFVIGKIKGRSIDGESDMIEIKNKICRRCLAVGIAYSLKRIKCLPHLRCDIGCFNPCYFKPQKDYISLTQEDLLKILHSELPEIYYCSYHRTKQPIIREGLPDLITSS